MSSKNSISFIFQPLIVVLFILFLFQSCSSKKYIFEKKDYLTQQQHFEYNFSPRKVKTRQLTPINSTHLSITKIIDREQQVTYRAYNVLNVDYNSLDFRKQIVYVVDDRPFLMKIDSMIISTNNQLHKSTSDVTKLDSTKVTVVTDYSISPQKFIRYTYTIPNEVMQQIKTSKKFFFYYQSETNIMNYRPWKRQKRALKHLIRSGEK